MWDVLKEKHPNLQEVDLAGTHCLAFKPYNKIPKVLPLNITSCGVKITASKIMGSGSLIGVDYQTLKDWCTRFGAKSEALREELVVWIPWIAKGSSPWVEYRALMSKLLMALDKCPDVRPVGIGEAICRTGLWQGGRQKENLVYQSSRGSNQT